MDEPIILNETDFEENLYDFFTHMRYKGQLFTGTLIQPAYNWTTEFKDGNAHGRNIEYYDNGQLAHDEVFENGNYKSGKEWYRNGQLKYDSIGKKWYEDGQLKTDLTGVDRLFWDKDGVLACQNDTWFYKNGQSINEKLPDGTTLLFTSAGELAAKQENLAHQVYNPVTKTHSLHRSYFYDDVLRRSIDELFTKPYPEFDNGPNHILWLFSWVGAVYAENIKKGHILLNHLLQHQEKSTQEHAAYLLSLAAKKESGSPEITYWLEPGSETIIM